MANILESEYYMKEELTQLLTRYGITMDCVEAITKLKKEVICSDALSHEEQHILSVFVHGMLCLEYQVKSDDFLISMIQHLLYLGFTLSTLATIFHVREEEIERVLQKKEVAIETKYEIACQLHRFHNLMNAAL